MDKFVKDLIEQHRLPDSFIETVDNYYAPLTDIVARRARDKGATLMVGINGAQGTGKSTLASFLGQLLLHKHQLRAVEISIDDLYLSKASRQSLAREVHPLLAVRGVPGTHQVDLGLDLLERLAVAGPDDVTAIPRFDKAADDRCPEVLWSQVQGRPDVVILEGWCVGARPQPDSDLEEAVNSLEREGDVDGAWRQYVNQQLAGPYLQLFGLLDLLIMISAPSFDCIYDWRLLQEDKLRESRIRQGLSTEGVMRPEQVANFIMYYQRLTTWQLEEMPSRADVLLKMDRDHRITSLSGI